MTARPPRPKDAASIVLIDGKGKKARVLIGKRNANLKFIPGKFVFPGGRLERGDRAMTVAGALEFPRRGAADARRLRQERGFPPRLGAGRDPRMF